jgi:ABC-type antimicrobial peptide transport system permease subunit
VLIAGLGGVIAAIVPARRGARMDILEAIAYE